MQSFLEFTDPFIPSATICALPPLTESSFEPHHFTELREMFAHSDLLPHEDYFTVVFQVHSNQSGRLCFKFKKKSIHDLFSCYGKTVTQT